jgi:hypothetical protein
MGAVVGLWGGVVVLLVGAPVLYLMYHPHPSLAPAALALRAAVGMLNAAIHSLVLAAFAGSLSAAVFRRRSVPEVEERRRGGPHFWRQFGVLFGAGLLGIASLMLILPELMRSRPLPPGAPELSPGALAALSLVNPLLLLALAVWVGIRLAPRVGFRSHLAERAAAGSSAGPPLWHEVPRAIAAGGAVAAVVVLLDWVFQHLWRGMPAAEEPSWSPRQLVSGMLYGGITEEILMRWGVLTLLVWLGWRFAQQSSGDPSPWIVRGAIVAAALLFGAGHLPAVAAVMPLNPMLVLRIVVLNALAGVVFGRLYWKHSLEAAMIAHATGHVVFMGAHFSSELFLTVL